MKLAFKNFIARAVGDWRDPACRAAILENDAAVKWEGYKLDPRRTSDWGCAAIRLDSLIRRLRLLRAALRREERRLERQQKEKKGRLQI